MKPIPNERIIPNEQIEAAIKKGKAERREGAGLEYIHFREDVHWIERGTIIIIAGDGNQKRIIPGYPHIHRIFTLERGLERNIKDDEIFIEEKIDGYNVRVISIDGEIFAFSRGGYLDLFVTEKAREMKLDRFFRENPGWTLCGEMIGNTPHTEPTREFDVRLQVFDVMDEEGGYLGCADRYALLDVYGILGVPRLGRFKRKDTAKLKKLFISLDKRGVEGMVIRGGVSGQTVKIVTPSSDIRDIAESSSKLFDMPIGFFYQRVLRSAFTTHDLKLKKNAQAVKLGHAFYDALIDAVDDATKGRGVYEDFEITIREPCIWDEVMRAGSKEIKISVISRKEMKDGRIKIKFRKEYRESSKTLISYANGKAMSD